ncbi:MAG: hypothetical protein U0169_19215 [Polyangiaceae bacterium]
MNRRWVVATVLAVVSVVRPAAADPDPRRDRGFPRPVAAAIAVVPGAVVHGLGRYATGDTRTGHRLLLAEGLGVSAFALGGAGLLGTGASRHTVAPFAALVGLGLGTFFATYLADVAATSLPEGTLGRAQRTLPLLEVHAGVRVLHDPTASYGVLAVQGFDLRSGRFRVSPEASVALDDAHGRYDVGAAWRFLGPTEGRRRSQDGTFLDAELDVLHVRAISDRTVSTSGVLSLHGRYDLARVGRSLAGTFAEGALGWGLQRVGYAAPAAEPDAIDVFDMRVAFGVYHGRRRAPFGETKVTYDHRRDTLVGGMKVPGRAAGILGSVGLTSRVYVTPRLGVAAEVAVGSAWMGGLSILWRPEAAP